MYTLLIRLPLTKAWTAPSCSEAILKIQKRMRYYHEEKGIPYDDMLVLDQVGTQIEIDVTNLPDYIGEPGPIIPGIPAQTRKETVKKDLFDEIPD